jgi:Zn-dependent peptidase ImmA (M78 family)
MMTLAANLSKARLYEIVTQKATGLGFDVRAQNYKIDSMRLAMQVCHNPEIKILEFSSIKICGLLYKGEFATTIGLNARRSAPGKNFDCMHELIHYWPHDQNTFYCLEGADGHMDWQANEGAAQFLMPYQSFIPNYCHLHDKFYGTLAPEQAYDMQVAALAGKYMVGEMAVRFRMESLKGEIAQYINGVAMDKIRIAPDRNRHE